MNLCSIHSVNAFIGLACGIALGTFGLKSGCLRVLSRTFVSYGWRDSELFGV